MRRPLRFGLSSGAISLSCVLSLSSIAPIWGQVPTNGRVPSPEPPGSRATMLSQKQRGPLTAEQVLRSTFLGALERTVWNTATRGTLLVVGVERGDAESDRGSDEENDSAAPGEADKTVPAAPPVDDRPSRDAAPLPPLVGLGDVARAFDRKPTRASTRGLGLADLEGEQRDLFLAFLPERLFVRTVQTAERELAPEGALRRVIAVLSQSAVGADALRGARLHMSRRVVSLVAIAETTGPFLPLHGVLAEDKDGDDDKPVRREVSERPFEPLHASPEPDEDFDATRTAATAARPTTESAFGTVVRQTIPSRPKAGQINFAAPALDKPMLLADAKTLGELVQRAAKATGIALHADFRYKDAAVFVRDAGKPVRTGDVLQTLALAVGGTWRRVENNLYVLTEDVEGLGVRVTRLEDWAEPLQSQLTEFNLANQRALWRNPIADIPFAPDSTSVPPLSASPGGAAAAPAAPGSSVDTPDDNITSYRAAVADFTPAVQEKIRRALAVFNSDEFHESWQARGRAQNADGEEDATASVIVPPPPRILETSVRVQTRVQLQLDVPGIGKVVQGDLPSLYITSFSFGDYETMMERSYFKARAENERAFAARQAALRQRALVCAPKNAREAVQFVVEAANAGLNRVWITAAQNEGSNDEAPSRVVLTAAVSAGKSRGIGIVAVVRAFSAAVSDKNALPLADINMFGETSSEIARRLQVLDPTKPEPDHARDAVAGDAAIVSRNFLRPDDPRSIARARERLRDVAATPELVAVVVRDLFPPG